MNFYIMSFLYKMSYKNMFQLLLVFFLVIPDAQMMTRQQIKSSGKLLKKTCMPKNDVTEDMVGEIEQGKFLDDKKVMCYIACVYSTSAVIKNNKIFHDAMIKQVDMMFPPEMKEGTKAVIEACRGVAKQYKDICEAAFYTAKCMYDADPKNFVFP